MTETTQPHDSLHPRDEAAGRVILVAEDDPALREIIVYKLKKHGFAVVPAADGRDAIDELRQRQRHGPGVALIVADLQMPRATGMDVLKYLAASNQAIPVIVISSFVSSQKSDELKRQGVSAVLSKPFDMHQLLATVDHLFHR